MMSCKSFLRAVVVNGQSNNGIHFLQHWYEHKKMAHTTRSHQKGIGGHPYAKTFPTMLGGVLGHTLGVCMWFTEISFGWLAVCAMLQTQYV